MDLEVNIIFIFTIFMYSVEFFKGKYSLRVYKYHFKNIHKNLSKIGKNNFIFMEDNLSLFGVHV